MTSLLKSLSVAVVAVLAAACSSEPGSTPTASPPSAGPGAQASVTPLYVPDNPSCTDLGHPHGFRIDPPASGTYSLDGINLVTVTIDPTTTYVDWTAGIGIDAVIVKGGNNANLYVYDPPSESLADTGLHSPINPSNGTAYQISHVDFCFDYEVSVAKTANPTFDRTYSWTIAKSSPVTSLTLATGETIAVSYTVAVAKAGYTDDDWAAAGKITVHNPAPFAAVVTNVADSLESATVALDCGVSFPYTLASNSDLVCTWSAELADAATRTNTVMVTTSGEVGGGSAQASIDFTGVAPNEIDECVDVTDDRKGDLGTACADTQYTYTLDVGPYDVCGDYTFDNTASFTGHDDPSATASYPWSIAVGVPCGGCTLTPGYWKTHSSYGPAHYDDAWALLLPSGENSTFFRSGQAYYQVLWNATAGNVYYTLARAYIAARLNGLNGAWLASVQTKFDAATALFDTYTPTDVGKMKASNAVRQQFVSLALALDDFDKGLVGPGHCSE